MAKTKHQKFSMATVKRSEIKGAPYNPRTITDEAAKRLRKNLRAVGLLTPIVVNFRTMHVVSGHQRLEALDALEKGTDYELDIAVVSLDEKAEKEQNLFFNNPNAQGEYDADKLRAMLWDGIDLDATGFTVEDLAVLDIDFEIPGDEAADAGAAAIARVRDRKSVKERRAESRAQANAQNVPDFYVTIVFRDGDARRDFARRYGLDTENPYVSAEAFERIVPPRKRTS